MAQIDLSAIQSLLLKVSKVKVYLDCPLGVSTAFKSFRLAIQGHESHLPVNKRRLSIASVAASIYRSEQNKDSPTNEIKSWHEDIPTARSDAELLAILWNNAEELIRLAKLGQRYEENSCDQ